LTALAEVKNRPLATAENRPKAAEQQTTISN
jgi:hypothetical protein